MSIYSRIISNCKTAERGAWLLPQREERISLRKASTGDKADFS